MITARRLHTRRAGAPEETTASSNPSTVPWGQHILEIQELTKAHEGEKTKLLKRISDLEKSAPKPQQSNVTDRVDSGRSRR